MDVWLCMIMYDYVWFCLQVENRGCILCTFVCSGVGWGWRVVVCGNNVLYQLLHSLAASLQHNTMLQHMLRWWWGGVGWGGWGEVIRSCINYFTYCTCCRAATEHYATLMIGWGGVWWGNDVSYQLLHLLAATLQHNVLYATLPHFFVSMLRWKITCFPSWCYVATCCPSRCYVGGLWFGLSSAVAVD